METFIGFLGGFFLGFILACVLAMGGRCSDQEEKMPAQGNARDRVLQRFKEFALELEGALMDQGMTAVEASECLRLTLDKLNGER